MKKPILMTKCDLSEYLAEHEVIYFRPNWTVHAETVDGVTTYYENYKGEESEDITTIEGLISQANISFPIIINEGVL